MECGQHIEFGRRHWMRPAGDLFGAAIAVWAHLFGRLRSMGAGLLITHICSRGSSFASVRTRERDPTHHPMFES